MAGVRPIACKGRTLCGGMEGHSCELQMKRRVFGRVKSRRGGSGAAGQGSGRKGGRGGSVDEEMVCQARRPARLL